MATLKQLKTFIAVAEYKKMNEAAKRLYISQPTVSQIILDLENEYQTNPKKAMMQPVSKQFFLPHASARYPVGISRLTNITE